MTATDFMNWRALLKGNYRKGVRAMEQIAMDGAMLAEFAASPEAVAVVFAFDPAAPDPNALELYGIIRSSGMADAAALTCLKKYVEADTLAQAAAQVASFADSQEAMNALACSDAATTALGGMSDTSVIASLLASPVAVDTLNFFGLCDSAVSAFAANSVYVSASVESGVHLSDVLKSDAYGSAVASAYEDSFDTADWATISNVSIVAAACPTAFSGYVGKSLPVSIEGYDGVTFSVADVGADTSDGNPVGFTFVCDSALASMAYGVRNTGTASANNDNWDTSVVRTWLNGELLNAMAAPAAALIKTVDKTTCLNSYYINSPSEAELVFVDTSESIWIPSTTEANARTIKDEQPASGYAIFAAATTDEINRRRVRKLSGETVTWWLRTMSTEKSSANIVLEDGRARSYATETNNERGVVPCFCI